MPSVRHLGLFPRVVFRPREENLSFDSDLADIWISSQPAFLYACAHYWRVKAWRVTSSATWTEGPGGTLFTTSTSDIISQGIDRVYFTDQEGEEDTVSGTNPSSESEIVCSYLNVPHSLVRSSQVAGGSGLTLRYSYNISGLSSEPAAIIRLDSGNVSEVKTPFRFSATTIRWKIETYEYAGNTGTYGTFTYSLLGQNFTAPFYANNTLGSNDLTISASLAAEEYWPYDPNDGGGPIYSSTTGTQLRDFPG